MLERHDCVDFGDENFPYQEHLAILVPKDDTGGAPWWRCRYDLASHNEKALGIMAGVPGGLTLTPASTLMRGLDPSGATSGATSSRRRGYCGIVVIVVVR